MPDQPPGAKLSRVQAARFLTEQGFPTAPATLGTKASRGGGPPYQHYGRIVVYEPDELLKWARARLGPVQRVASERGVGRPRRR